MASYRDPSRRGPSAESDGSPLVPLVVLVPERQRSVMLANEAALPAARLAAPIAELYDEAMDRFDARCFWSGRPPRSMKGARIVAERLEAYGSSDALRLCEALRCALGATGG